ncbi:MAG: hypothetical protein RI907_1742 [Pseudomonadota bacterium]|jgi:cytoskeleton protein RodZ
MTEGSNANLGALFNAPDASTQGPGDILRRARESQRLSIEALAANIKVSPAKLEALESGRFNELPDANFTRALAMTLCRALKVEPGPVLAALPAARPAALVSDSPPLNQPFKASRASMRLFDSSIDWSGFFKPQWIAPAVLLVAAAILYATPGASDWPSKVAEWWHRSEAAAVPEADAAASEAELPVATGLPQELPAAESASGAAPGSLSATLPATLPNGQPVLRLDSADGAASAPVTVAAPNPAVPASTPEAAAAPAVTVSPNAPTAPPAPAATPAAPAPVSVSNSQLSLRAREATWVEIKDAQGNRLLGRLILRDEVVDMSVPPPLTLRIGNAGGMTLSYKGQPVDLVPHTRNNVARLELK